MARVSDLTLRHVGTYDYYGSYVDGKWKSLGSTQKITEQEAKILHAKLVIESNDTSRTDNDNRPCKAMIPIYLAAMQEQATPKQLREKNNILGQFLVKHGEKLIKDISPQDLEDWWNGNPSWNQGGKSSACAHVCACFNWLFRGRKIKNNPAMGVKRVKSRARDASVLFTDSQFDQLLQAMPDYMQRITQALRWSGCRPSEVLTLEANQFLPEQKLWVIPADKRKIEEKPREVGLCEPLVALCMEQVKRYPTGYLFGGKNGRKMHANDYSQRFRDAKIKAGLADTAIIPYSTRHTFCNKMAGEGFSDAELAELLGNTPEVIREHYKHAETHRTKLHQRMSQVWDSSSTQA